MIIGNAKVFLDGSFQDASVTIENGRITAIGELDIPCDMDAGGRYLVPGFVDIHTHGAMNEDFSDGKPEGLQKMARYYAANGVTAFLATTMTLKEETLLPAMETIGGFVRPENGAKCAGIHLEGPFLSYFLQLNDQEIADILHITSAGVGYRRAHGIKQLRSYIADLEAKGNGKT